jgi:hypothetical protein
LDVPLGAAGSQLVARVVAGAEFDKMQRQETALMGPGGKGGKGGKGPAAPRVLPPKRKLVDGAKVGHFRVGRGPGGWREHFTAAQSAAFDAAVEDHLGRLPPVAPDGHSAPQSGENSRLRLDYGLGVTWQPRGSEYA